MRSLLALLVLFGMVVVGCHSNTVKGPEGQELTVTTPADVSIARGQSKPVRIDLDRKNFTDAVTVSISQLPTGVRTDQVSRTVETDAATFMLVADRSAHLVKNHAVAVTVRGPDGMEATEHFELDVTE